MSHIPTAIEEQLKKHNHKIRMLFIERGNFIKSEGRYPIPPPMDIGLKFGAWIKRMLFFAVFLRNKCPVSAIKCVGGMTVPQKHLTTVRAKNQKLLDQNWTIKFFLVRR